MKKNILVILSFLIAAQMSYAAMAKIDLGDDAHIDVGARLQTIAIFSEKDLDGDGGYESYDDFKVRRGRLRLKAAPNDMMYAFLQTDVGSTAGGGGRDMRVIDAFFDVKLDPMFHVIAGINMAPASRQNLTSSGGLMCLDYAGMVYKSLTWGARSVYTFANATYSDTDSGLRGDNDVRDTGVTFFGSTSISDTTHFKYYVGAYDGIDYTNEDNLRYTARVQLNLMDAESGYFNLSTYAGTKNTFGIGLGYDTQSDVAADAMQGNVDYKFTTADLFFEKQIGDGAITAELGYMKLDLDDATMLYYNGTDAMIDATRSQGDGLYLQLGYYINQWQPWILLESWDSDASDGKGSYDITRVGITYFIKGHAANVKAGYEIFKTDENIGSSTEDQVKSFVTGIYLTY